MPSTARAAVLTAPKQLHTHSFDVTEAERAIQTLAGAFPDEQPVHIAIVPKP